MLIEIARGGVTNRGYIIDSNELVNYINDKHELYRSYFGFNDLIKAHIESGRKTPQGFIGEFFLGQLVLDMDKGSDTIEHTLHKVKLLATRLIDEFGLDRAFQLWFSGTGFHFHMDDIFGFKPSNKLPGIVRQTISNVFPEVDVAPIQPRGLIRVAYTINEKSGLYKIPIPQDDIWLMTKEELFERAKTSRRELALPIRKNPPRKYPDLIVEPIEFREARIETVRPNRIATCTQHMYNAGPIQGTRHSVMLRMVSKAKRDGTPFGIILAGMKEWGHNMEEYEVVKSVTDVFNKDYTFGCNDTVMAAHCDPQCVFHNKKNYLTDIFGSAEVEKDYIEEIKGDWAGSSINLAGFLGIEGPRGYWLRPGHVIGILGDTGVSKSALLQNLAVHFKDFGDMLFINTEMPHWELYERFMQIAHLKTIEEVRDHHKASLNGWSQAISHIKQSKVIPDYDGIVSMVKALKPKLLMIDVVDDIDYKGKRDTSAQETMYKELKDLTRQHRMITFMVRHITKSAAMDEDGRNRPLTKHAAKGSSAFEQKCDVVIGIEGNTISGDRTVKHMKGRSTPYFLSKFTVSSETFKYHLNKEKQDAISEKSSKQISTLFPAES